jgi:hypothetical protein
MPERSWHDALLSYKNHKRLGAIIACNTVAVLPGVQDDTARLKTSLSPAKHQQNVDVGFN